MQKVWQVLTGDGWHLYPDWLQDKINNALESRESKVHFAIGTRTKHQYVIKLEED